MLKKIKTLLLFSLILNSFACYEVKGQTEKGMFSLGGLFKLTESELNSNRNNIDFNELNTNIDGGYFLTNKHFIGGKLNIQRRKSLILNFDAPNSTELITQEIEAGIFYRYYLLPNLRVGTFGEAKLDYFHLKQSSSQQASIISTSVRSTIGLGAYFFLSKNNVIEVSLNTPIVRWGSNFGNEDLIWQLAVLRSFKRPVKTQLPKLESKYLFVRNFYYGFNFTRTYGFSTVNTAQNEFNFGIFLTSRWLLDLSFSHSRIKSTNNAQAFRTLGISAESTFFIPINEKGLYFRPSIFFSVTPPTRTNSSPIFSSGNNSYSSGGNFELARFVGSRLIIGGGAAFRVTESNRTGTHRRYSCVLRTTWFLNQDFALETVADFYLYDSIQPIENQSNFSKYPLTDIQIKFRAFLFQK